MKFNNKYKILSLALLSISSVFAQDSFILNYEDVDIKKVTQDIAQFSKKTIILDPRVKGKITIYSNANLNRKQVWDVYLRTIQVNGFSAISEDGFLRVVPENEATRDKTADTSGGGFETVVIPLINRSTEEILPMIKPITGRQSHLSSIPSVNSILLVDRASNVERIRNLLSDLDKNNTAQIEHEATTSKIGEDQIFYCNQRGIDTEKAIALIVNGFSKEVLNKLPMEFAVEAQKLLEISLEGSVG